MQKKWTSFSLCLLLAVFLLCLPGIAEAKSATYCFKSQPGWQHSGIAKIQYVFAAKNHGQVIEPNGKTCKEQKAEISLVFLRVKEGDTLYSLSKNYGTSVEQLKLLNKLNGFKIVPGQILRIPICWKLTPMPKPQPKPQPWPQPKPEPEPQPEPKPIPELQPEPEPQPQPEPQPEPEPQSEPQPEPEPEPQPVPGLNEAEQKMLDLVNAERSKAGLAPLKIDMELVRLARLKSQDMIDLNYFSHQSPTYGSPFDMMKAAGITYRLAGENLAGAPTVERAHTGLMNSSGHRANILNPNYTHIGIGAVSGGRYGMMFTQMFVGR
ncbi:MAG: LysM peptidoglycan-binding domain-containing protein [Firmicutes bacterium]|nr:LysM peptidoglycan-binding domain-containing protein [Bacillota bacterium]